MIHVVICDNKTKELEKIINKERKILIRGNNSRRIPHSRIFVDDELYFVERNSYISNYHAIVKNAENYSKLTKEELDEIFDTYKNDLNLDDSEIKKWKKKCICIIKFDNLEHVNNIEIPKYNTLDDWLMFDSLEEMQKR